MKSNKKRLLTLIDILKKHSDMEHKLSLNKIVTYLQDYDIEISNRKTLYDDFKILSDAGLDIEYDNGYYLSEAPFSLSEIKILIDSLNSLKNIDNKVLQKIQIKLYSFVSTYEEELLTKLEYHNKHKDAKFINRLEDTLEAIRTSSTLIIQRKNKDEEEIGPIFLYRNNDYYYLYYHYINSEKIYHTRFDNILNTKLTNNANQITIPKNKIIAHIEESSNAYYSNKAETIEIKIINDTQLLRDRLIDDFSNIIFTKDGFSIKASVNNVFFSKLVAYGTDIKISDTNIANSYTKYLKDIINQNK